MQSSALWSEPLDTPLKPRTSYFYNVQILHFKFPPFPSSCYLSYEIRVPYRVKGSQHAWNRNAEPVDNTWTMGITQIGQFFMGFRGGGTIQALQVSGSREQTNNCRLHKHWGGERRLEGPYREFWPSAARAALARSIGSAVNSVGAAHNFYRLY